MLSSSDGMSVDGELSPSTLHRTANTIFAHSPPDPFQVSPSDRDGLQCIPELLTDGLSEGFPVHVDAYLDQLSIPELPDIYATGIENDCSSPQKQHPDIDPFLIALSSPLINTSDQLSQLQCPHYWLPSSAIDPALEEAYLATLLTG